MQFGTEAPEWVEAMAFGADGRIHIVGETIGQHGPDEADVSQDLFVVTLADGAVERMVHRGTPHDENAKAIAVGPCGAVYIAGSTDGELAGAAHGDNDGFVLEVR